jgi:hypothetical protein
MASVYRGGITPARLCDVARLQPGLPLITANYSHIERGQESVITLLLLYNKNDVFVLDLRCA